MSPKGFTLIELAIALMVIGLLIGGVLKGQELIENAKITATVREFKSYETAVMMFRSTYKGLPGDFRYPERIPNCTTEICNTPGNGNRTYGDGLYHETFNFFPHLKKAGMIQGPEGGTSAEMYTADYNLYNDEARKFYPETPIGHIGMVMTGATAIATQTDFYFSTQVRPAMRLDEKMDDGKPQLGSIISAGCDLIGSGPDLGAYTYDTTSTSPCYLWVNTNI